MNPAGLFRSESQELFASLLSSHLTDGGAPLCLEGAAGLGKTRAYLFPLLSTKKPVAVCVPTRALAEQLSSSNDLSAVVGSSTVAVFSPRHLHHSDIDYEKHKIACRDSDLLICTHSSALVDILSNGQLFNLQDRHAIVFDEADQMPEAASLRMDFSIHSAVLSACGISSSSNDIPRTLSKLKSFFKLNSTNFDIQERASVIASLNAIAYAVKKPSGNKTVFFDSAGALVLQHRLPGRLFGGLYEHSRLAFVSATLGVGGGSAVERFKPFMRSMGLKSISETSSVIEPKDHGQLLVVSELFDHTSSDHLAKVATHINSLDGFVLVATASKADALELLNLLPDGLAAIRETIQHDDGRVSHETAQIAAQRLNSTTRVLLAFGAWAGLDTSVKWSHVVMPRAPFNPPVEGQDDSRYSYIQSAQIAVRRFKQCLSRGLRTTDAYCHLHLLDRRFQRPMFQQAIPERFADQRGYSSKFSWVERRTQQAKFRKSILSRYENQCAISGEANTTVLQAAHWRSSNWRRDHDGICLRSDLHLLFDKHELNITKSIDGTTAVVSLVGDLNDKKWDAYRQFHSKIIKLK